MSIIKVLLITLLAAVGGGCIVGVIVGKRSVKRALEGSKPLLSLRERIVYAGMLLAGIACVVIGIFVVGRTPDESEMASLDGDLEQFGEYTDEMEIPDVDTADMGDGGEEIDKTLEDTDDIEEVADVEEASELGDASDPAGTNASSQTSSDTNTSIAPEVSEESSTFQEEEPATSDNVAGQQEVLVTAPDTAIGQQVLIIN